MLRTCLFALAFCLTVSDPSGAVAAQQQTPALPGLPGEYIVGPQDSLIITVVGFPDLSGKFGVNADGTFTFPYIGRIVAAGLTPRAIERELAKRLIGYVRDPEVTVSLEQSGSRRYFVMGEVRQSGRFTLTGAGQTNLIEALSRAGFTTPDAGREVLVYRGAAGPDGSPRAPGGAGDVVRVNLDDIDHGKLTNVAIGDGDLIVIPRAGVAFVFGHVQRNGAFPIRDETTVLELLAIAGGVTERGAINRISILRQVNGKWEEIKPELTDVVRAGDIINVPEKRI
jgi:polysaccharide export outer membrane protein